MLQMGTTLRFSRARAGRSLTSRGHLLAALALATIAFVMLGTVALAAPGSSLAYRTSGGGAITGIADQSGIPGVSGTPVTATALTGWRFANWQEDLSASPTRADVFPTIGTTTMFTANFLPNDPMAITGLRSPSHPSDSLYYSNSRPTFSWAVTDTVVGYTWLLDRNAGADGLGTTIDTFTVSYHDRARLMSGL